MPSNLFARSHHPSSSSATSPSHSHPSSLHQRSPSASHTHAAASGTPTLSKSARASLLNVLTSRGHETDGNGHVLSLSSAGSSDGGRDDISDVGSMPSLAHTSSSMSTMTTGLMTPNIDNNIDNRSRSEFDPKEYVSGVPFAFISSSSPSAASSTSSSNIDHGDDQEQEEDLSEILKSPIYFGPNGRLLSGQSQPRNTAIVITIPPAINTKLKSNKKGKNGADAMVIASSTNVLPARHSEFGWDTNQNWRYTSQYNPNAIEPEEREPGYIILLTTYASYLMLIILGHIRDFFGKRFDKKSFGHLMPSKGYAALNSDFDSFYTRRLKARLEDCFARPTTGVPGRTLLLNDRVSHDSNHTFQLTGTQTRALNISSYNYLGFAQATGGCADAVEACIQKYGVNGGGARLEAGTLDLHQQAEKLCANFIGTEDAMIISMGFATNSTTIPALVDKGCLVISDEFNHSSIRFGVRLSGASVRMFKHNNIKDLEKLLREVIAQGRPRTHRPWKKILVIVEGLYSMEGNLVNLPELVVLKERYKFYLYVDEAHSIGAMGPNGRGVCDYFGVDPRCVDILMGTFTKSFGAAGGYIAGSKELIDRLKCRSHAMTYAEGISPPVLTQIIASMASIMGVSPPLIDPTPSGLLALSHSSSSSVVYGPACNTLLPEWMHLPPALLNGTEGRERLRRLAFNSRYLSTGLRKLGFIVYGHRDSPIVPLLIYNPGKMPAFSRMMLNRVGKDRTPIIVVVVAYPATPLISSRVRFCLSAAHTKHDIDLILRACDEVGDILGLKMHKSTWTVDEVIRRAEELVKED